jgi:hypothetical protein
LARAEPYPDLDSVQAVLAVRDGFRLPIPEDTPSSLSQLISDCWQTDPDA